MNVCTRHICNSRPYLLLVKRAESKDSKKKNRHVLMQNVEFGNDQHLVHAKQKSDLKSTRKKKKVSLSLFRHLANEDTMKWSKRNCIEIFE